MLNKYMVLSVFKNNKTKTYNFIDNMVKRAFTVGGTIVNCYRYIGPVPQPNTGDQTITSTPTNNLSIQDIIFLENRDRQYDKNVYDLRTHYVANDFDFNLSSIGIILGIGKTLILNFHINDTIARLGRKLMPGDVLELINRKEDVVLNEAIPFINAFYVVKDVTRAADGYSPTWYPHILRCTCEQITDSVEYKPILDILAKKNLTVRDMISTQEKTLELNKMIQDQAIAEVPYRYQHDSATYTNVEGSPMIYDNAVQMIPFGPANGRIPPNQDTPANSGTMFPSTPNVGDYFIRDDYRPPRMFRRNQQNNQWLFIWDCVQTPYEPGTQTLKRFLNDSDTTNISPAQVFNTRRPITDTLPPGNIVETVIPDDDENNDDIVDR